MSPRAPRTDPYGRNSRIRLPPWVFDGEAFVRPGMCDSRSWKPPILQHGHPFPGHLPLLTTPTQRAPPDVGDVKTKVPERHRVRRNRVISIEAHHNPPQPRPLLIDRLVHPSSQFLLDHPQSGAHPVAARFPPELETSPPVLPADVGKTKKVKRLRFAETACPPVRCRVASELNEPRLLRVQRQGERRQTCPHILPEPLGIGLMLEANDDVVSVSHNDDVAMGVAFPPLIRPQIEDVMQVD